MQGDAGVSREPGPDLGVLVGGVVVADHAQFGAGVGGGDLLEEAQELLVAVPGVAGVGDRPGGDLQGCEQAGDSAPGVVVGLPLGDAASHRQDRLAALQRLALALFVYADDHRILGRVQVQAHASAGRSAVPPLPSLLR